MEKILVTGTTGSSGQYFLDELIAAFPEDVSIRALVRKTSDRAKLEKLIDMGKSVELFEGDMTDVVSIKEMTLGIDIVFHIAGISASLDIVRAAIANGVKRLVLVHTTGIYSKYKAAGESYRQTEAEIRRLIAAANEPIDLTILRPTMIYGNLKDQNMVKFIKMTDKLRFFPMVKGGHYALQPVHHQDLGRAYLQVLNMLLQGRQPCGTDREYILSGGTVIDLIDIMKLISEYLGKRTTFFSVPFGIAYAGAWGVFLISLGKADFREKVQRLVEPRNYPHDAATRDFGYNPMPFAEGLRREVEMYKSNKRRNQ
jgi:nucleoside-diphosphate-sugar epimerase